MRPKILTKAVAAIYAYVESEEEVTSVALQELREELCNFRRPALRVPRAPKVFGESSPNLFVTPPVLLKG